MVIDFGTTSRSLHRSLQCLSDGGVVLISDEVAEKLLPKFSRKAEERKQHIEPVPTGTIEQLRDLVQLVAQKQVRLTISSCLYVSYESILSDPTATTLCFPMRRSLRSRPQACEFRNSRPRDSQVPRY